MTLNTFITLASSANLSVVAVGADLNPCSSSRWSKRRTPIATCFEYADELAERDGIDAEDALWEMVLESSVVIAVDENGKIRGGYSPCGWLLGSRELTVDQVYAVTYAG